MIRLVKMKMTTKIVFGNIVKKKFTKILPKYVKFMFEDSIGLKPLPIYKTMKVVNYFRLKSMTPWVCAPMYSYTCPCDTGLTYLGMSSKHLVTRAKEHLGLNQSRKSAMRD